MSLSYIFFGIGLLFGTALFFTLLYFVIFMWNESPFSARMDNLYRAMGILYLLLLGAFAIGGALEIYEMNKRHEKYELEIKKIREQS